MVPWLSLGVAGHPEAPFYRSLNNFGPTPPPSQVNPEQFTRTLLEESGAEVRIATLAGLVVENGAVAGVRLEPRDGGPATTMPADTVIIATGAWTGALRAAIPGLPAITGQKVGAGC